MGNDASTLKSSFESRMVLKSLDTVLLRQGSDCLFTYTTIAESATLTDDDVSDVPLLAQELLLGKTDIRVTVAGDKIFAVRILAHGRGIEGDWRVTAKDRLTFEDFDLTPPVKLACRKLVSDLGLSFAAIDLVEMPYGTVFIEINPTGEWAWLSTPQRAIDVAIADWLSSPKHAEAGR